MTSKTEIEGQKILTRLLEQSDDFGGAFGYITGAMGGGKTSAMLSWIVYTLIHYPHQKIFLSETYDAPLQFFKLGFENCKILVKKGSGIIFRDRNSHLTPFEELDVAYFTSYDDMYQKAENGKVNVPFFGNRTDWMGLVAYLRHTGDWNHVFIDEIGEVVPANSSGGLHKKIGQFSIFIKDVRKCRMKVIANTQSVRDMDWRLLDKFMFRVFLPGAMADKKHSRVTQRAIDNLIGNENYGNDAYIDRVGRFGKISFLDIFKPYKGYSIEAHNSNVEEYMIMSEEDAEADRKRKKKTKKKRNAIAKKSKRATSQAPADEADV